MECDTDLDDWVVEARDGTKPLGIGSGPAQGCVCSDADPVLLAELHKRFTLEVRVCLDLVDRRLYLGICQDVSGEEDVVIAA
jgi:hypothetical protein